MAFTRSLPTPHAGPCRMPKPQAHPRLGAYASYLTSTFQCTQNGPQPDPPAPPPPPFASARRSQRRYMSAGAAFLCQSAGRVWFEVEVLAVSDYMVVGFAGTNFRGALNPLGADERGWGVAKSGAATHRRAGVGWSGRFCGC